MTLIGAPVSELELTGERFHPTMRGAIRYEHLHRYALCLSLVDGLDVLDIASGEGYGSALLASRARKVIGVDLDPRAVEHARRTYYRPNVRYLAGDCTAVPLADASVDVVVSFETLEHIEAHDQMLSEIRRVLRPGGRLVISSPNKLVYSDEHDYANPYHARELYYDEFVQLLERHFAHVRVHGQRLAAASFVYPLAERLSGGLPSYGVNGSEARDGLPVLDRPMYFLAVCSDAPHAGAGIDSLFVDAHDDLLERLQDEHARALRYIRSQQTALEGASATEPLRLAPASARAVTPYVESFLPAEDVPALRRAVEQLTAERDAIAANRESIAAHRDALEANRASIAAHRDEILAEHLRVQRRLDAVVHELYDLRELTDACSVERDAATVRAETLACERDALVAAAAEAERERGEAAAAHAAAALSLEGRLDVATADHYALAVRAERDRREHVVQRGRLEARIDALVLDLHRAGERADASAAERDAAYARAERERGEHDADRARAQSRVDALVLDVARLGARLDAVAAERDAVAARAAHDARTARELLASRSWRLTAPLRALAKPFK